jgi:molybdopterin-guanine dinucleotide biosynthesis protein
MDDTPVVVIVGPRQSGKSTLAALVAEERDARQVTLDDAGPRAAANADPTGFVEALEQRAGKRHEAATRHREPLPDPARTAVPAATRARLEQEPRPAPDQGPQP